jgi:energy-converting hydrogenase Eha subunit E
MTTGATATRTPLAGNRSPQFRFAAVFALVLTLVLFEVLAPGDDWARAVAVALAGGAVTVAVATSRARATVRRARAWLVGGFAFLVVIGIAAGVIGAAISYPVVTLLVLGIPVALVGGLLRLIRTAGVTVQVVAGALTVYLVVGLLFASIIAFAATVESSPYFAQGKKVSNGERVYYSFTALTTTGFGDFTPAEPFGHALAVLEMLTGQLYLVTVIGIVVGNFAGRRTARDVQAQRSQPHLEET